MPSESDRAYRFALILAGATLVGFVLRCWPFGRLGLNQFDEGIYTLAGIGLSQAVGQIGFDPTLIPYALPGYPLLVAALTSFTGPSDQAALLVSALMGTLTIPLGGLLAATFFGRRSGVALAWLICCGGPHIAFSRMALTDVSFLFFWLLTFWAGYRFLDHPGGGRGFLLGLGVGCTQQFKYHGWLVGILILFTALARLTIRGERDRYRWTRVFGWGGSGVIVATLVILPWVMFVEGHGGYGRLLAHQRSYLTGWGSWWEIFKLSNGKLVPWTAPSLVFWQRAA